jgi:hypothetical protein
MRNLIYASLAALALSTGAMATAAYGLAHEGWNQAQVDTGVGVTPSDEGPAGIVMRVAVVKDGKEVFHTYYGMNNRVALFATEAACNAIRAAPWFAMRDAELAAFVAEHFPGAEATVSCVSAPQEL